MSRDEDEGGTDRARRNRLQWLGRPVPLIGALFLVVLLGLWVQRAPLAENLIERELAARDVHMRYRLASVGLRTQRIENIVLGDPRRPDLTARWVEVDIAIGGLSPVIAGVRAGGVRMRGRLHNGKLSLGELDKFMGQGAATTTVLPDIDVALEDARASIATDYGPLGVNLSGSGNLHDAFVGRAVAAMPDARVAQCGARRLVADLRVAMRNGEPRITGPLTAQAIGCPATALALAMPRLDVDFRLDKTLSALNGGASIAASAVRAGGMTLGLPSGQLSAKVDDSGVRGGWTIAGRTLAGRGVIAGQTMVQGALSRDNASHEPGWRVEGRVTVRDMAASAGDPLRGFSAAVSGTPASLLADKLAEAVRLASRDNRLSASFVVRTDVAGGTAELSDLHFASASGARVDLPGGSRAALRWPDGAWSLDGGVTLGGGGLPRGSLLLAARPGGGFSGRLDIAPYMAGSSRLALAPVVFSEERGGRSRFSTVLALDGPLADGAVSGLVMPLSGTVAANGTLLLNDRCAPLRWRSLRVSSLTLDPTALTLCPRDGAMLRFADGRAAGGIQGGRVALTGRIGASPLILHASSIAAGVAETSFNLRGVEARIGKGESPVVLRAATLDGAAHGGALAGHFGQGSGRIGTVPLDLSDMAARWQFAKGRLDVDGGLRVADTQKEARFNPLRSEDAHLALVGGKITATGHLRHPVRANAFARVDIAHDLSTGSGNAAFALEGLRFGSQLQPDDLTPIALGVVANVEGLVEGGGNIVWTSSVVRSTGHFRTSGMNLAAAFGPVSGLSTSLAFTDLLGLETGPGQIATIKSINPGIEVHDGRVSYQFLRDRQVRIEGGEWPFSGGRLALLPTTLDFDAKRARNLVFRVTGLDAGAFINTLDLKNISATGTYDGLLPMIFDASGGRIEGGILVARQQGLEPLVVENARTLTVPCDPKLQAGTLSYVGEVSNAELGTFGRLAFDALKHLRYKCLTILLDGALDGEFVTQIAINGFNQGSAEGQKSAMLRPFLGLPFIFNVKIQAPFRGLLNTYQSFVDPSTLIRNSLGPQYQSVLNNGLAVQPSDSDK